MALRRIRLTDFRTYSDEVVEFSDGVSCLVGPNGVGKTNLIEAAAFLSTLSSHRVSVTAPLVKKGASHAVVSADIGEDGSSTRVDVEISPGKSLRVRVAGVPALPRNLIGKLRTVLFAPEDLVIVKGDPAARRGFADRLLVQRSPRYHAVIADFDRVVRQRTALLRSLSGRRSPGHESSLDETLRVWDEQLVAAAAQLLRGRQLLLSELAGPVRDAYAALAPGSGLSVSYNAKSLGEAAEVGDIPTDLKALEGLVGSVLASRRRDEIDRGQTLVGPHRDDVNIEINGMPARGYASHGESWSAALALRIGSFEVLKALDEPRREPLLLLDDVFAELDEGRREHLAEMVGRARQAIITAAVPADIPPGLGGTRFDVVPGSVRRVERANATRVLE